MKPRFHTVHAFPLAAALLTSSFVRAGQIWDGTGGADNNWNTPANWDGDALPTFTNAITFVGNVRNGAVNDLTAASVIGGIDLTNDGTAGKTNAFTLSGNSITLGGDITTTASSASITDTISLAMTLDGSRVITTNTNHNLIVGTVVSETGGAQSLTKNGVGTLRFDGINTYSGTSTINAGTVEVRAGTAGGSAVWGTGPITLGQGALLFFSPANQAIQNTPGFSVAGAITLGGGAGTSTIRFAGNDNKYVLGGGVTGQAAVSQTLALIQGGSGNGDRLTSQITGAIADGAGGSLGVSVDFAGSSGIAQRSYANFSGPNTFTGDLTITNSRGLNGTGTHPGAWLTIGGLRHDGFSAPTLVSEGTGYLGTGATYSGNISISNGSGGLTTLGFLTSANQILGGVISGTGSLNQRGTGTLTLNAANTFSGTTTIASSGPIIMGNALALQNSPLVTTSTANSLTLFGTPTSLQLGGLSGASGSLGTIITGSAYNNINALTLNPQAGVTVTYGGVLADGAAGMSLTKTGPGTQILSGNNTYTGITTVTQGTLILSGSNSNSGGFSLSSGILNLTRPVSQPATGTIAVGTGTTLAINVGGASGWSTATTGNGSIGGVLAGLGGQSGGTITYSGNVTIGLDTTNVASAIYSGLIANVGDSLSINKLGPNTLILSGSNTYTGGTTITGGTLQFAKLVSQPAAGTVTVGTGATLAVNVGGVGEWTTGTSGNGTIGGLLAGLGGQSGGTVAYIGNVALGFDTTNGGPTQTYTGAIGNVGTTLGITKLGTNTLVLAGTNTYTGATTVNSGTLLLDTDGGGALATTSALILGGGNFQVKGKTSGTTTQTLGALTLTANKYSAITLDSNGGSGTTLTLPNSAPTRGVGSSLLIDRSIANTTLSSTLGLAAAAQTTTQAILGYALVKDATGTGFAANVGGSIVRYTGADATFSGTSNSSTTNFITTPTGTSTTGSPYLTTAASPSYNSLHIDTASATGANFLSLNGTVTLSQRAVLMTGSNAFTIQSGILGANNSEVIVHQLGTGALTISSTLSGGLGSLTKTGTGPLTLDATNSYSGGTVVHAGNVTYTKKGAFGSGTITLPDGITLKKIAEEGNNAGLATSNNITLNGQVTMDVDFSTAKDQWFTGVISGSGSLRVIGEGFVGRALTLANANTFSGGVTLNTTTSAGAWIQIGNANALGTGTLTINATGGIQDRGLGASTALTSGSGVANNIVINSGATFNLGGQSASGNVLLSGIISGSGNLNKSDLLATTFTLGGANTYTGNTTVNTGTLVLADNAQLKFVLGATSGSNNSISGAGTVTLDGDFVIDTSDADALASGTWTLENVPSLSGAYGSTFTVVGFTDAGSNKWTKPNGAKTYTFDETTGILTLASSAGYSSWASMNGAGPNLGDDHDNDGVDNGTEYFLGGPNGNTTGFTFLPGVDSNLGILSVTWDKGAGYIGAYNSHFVVETSTTLDGPWVEESSPGSVTDSPTSVTYTFPGGPAYSGKRFARLKVTGP